MWQPPDNVTENKSQHNRAFVFRDRDDAGRQLAALLGPVVDKSALVLAIPAGGVPVAAAVAEALGLALSVLVVSKITLPWNTEAGYGAVAADGTSRINEPLAQQYRLDPETIDEGMRKTTDKVRRREQQYREIIGSASIANNTIVLVDDGLASGFTLRVAIASAHQQGAAQVIVAVPTGHSTSVIDVAAECDQLYCVNVREGMRYAVAEAYEQWSDVSEDEVLTILKRHKQQRESQ